MPEEFEPVPIPTTEPEASEHEKSKQVASEYVRRWTETYALLNKSVEGGKKHRKKNRRSGSTWQARQRIFQKLKHGTPGHPRRGRN